MDFLMPDNLNEEDLLAKKIYKESVENMFYHSQRKGGNIF